MPKQTEFKDPEIAAIFAGFPSGPREKLMRLRQLIFDTAKSTDGVGDLEEVLKWGEPSYITSKTKSGSTIRINWKASLGEKYAMYFICSSNLVSNFKEKFPNDFEYEGNRAIIFNQNEEIPEDKLIQCIKSALTYHLNK